MPSWWHPLIWSPLLRKKERLRRTICWLSPILWARCWQRQVANYFVVVTYFIITHWFQWHLAHQNWLYQKFHIRCFVTDTMTKIHLFKWWKTSLLRVSMTHPQVRIDTISHNLYLKWQTSSDKNKSYSQCITQQTALKEWHPTHFTKRNKKGNFISNNKSWCARCQVNKGRLSSHRSSDTWREKKEYVCRRQTENSEEN